jgi:hypothetical protein
VVLRQPGGFVSLGTTLPVSRGRHTAPDTKIFRSKQIKAVAGRAVTL